MTPTILYGIIEGRPGHANIGKPFYVGIGGAQRPRTHFKCARSERGHANLLMQACLTEHFAIGIEPTVSILGTYDKRVNAVEAEIAAIKRYGRLGRDPGGILCNIARGGDGFKVALLSDPDLLASIAAATKLRWNNPQYRAAREAIMREVIADPQWVTRVSEATVRALRKPETRAKHLAALERINAARTLEQYQEWAKRRSPESQARSTAALLAVKDDPVVQAKRRENMREPMRQSWASPEKRAKRVAALRGVKKTASPEALAARRANMAKAKTTEALEKKAAGDLRKWRDPAFRAKRSRNQSAAWADPEKRERMLAGRAEGIAKSWSDPEVRARRIAGIKAAAAKRAEDQSLHKVEPSPCA